MSNLPKRMKLMPDYECWCLWDMDSGKKDRLYNVDPKTLPLSSGLKADLEKWEDEFDAILVRDNPIESGFETPAAEHAFVEIGWKLLARLSAELSEIEFYYFDISSSQLLKSKSS